LAKRVRGRPKTKKFPLKIKNNPDRLSNSTPYNPGQS
jgi:hypothetical protein